MGKKLFLFIIFGIIFTKTSYAVDCSATNPTIVEHGSTPTTWQRVEASGNKYKTDIYVNTDVSSAVKILYSIGAQNFTPLELGCSDGVNNVRRTTVGGLPEGNTVNFGIKVYKTSDVNGIATDVKTFSVVIPSGLAITNVTNPVVAYPDSYVAGGTNKPSVVLKFNTNIDSIGSIEVTLPNNSVIGPAQYAPFKESAFTTTPRIHTFTMGNLVPGTYTYVINAFYNASSTTPADSRGSNTFVVAPPATPEPTPTAVPCGSSVGGACCITSPKCTINVATSVFLHCTGIVCSSFRSLVISATDWFNGFTGRNNLYDFDSNGSVGGKDYALWLKAGNHL